MVHPRLLLIILIYIMFPQIIQMFNLNVIAPVNIRGICFHILHEIPFKCIILKKYYCLCFIIHLSKTDVYTNFKIK